MAIVIEKVVRTDRPNGARGVVLGTDPHHMDRALIAWPGQTAGLDVAVIWEAWADLDVVPAISSGRTAA